MGTRMRDQGREARWYRLPARGGCYYDAPAIGFSNGNEMSRFTGRGGYIK